MEPFFDKNDKQLFYKYLKNASYYFEFGSGGSTYQASLCSNIHQIFSVESDKQWYQKVQSLITKSNICYLFCEMHTKPNTFGHPGLECTNEQKRNYSNQINEMNIDVAKKVDMILIDGRFRVACCLKCFQHISNDCIICFDDFLNRKQYHVVLNFFDIIEKTSDNKMVILKKKKEITSIPSEIIEEYELIKD